MKLRAVFFFATLLFMTPVFGQIRQTRTLTLKVIDEEFNPLSIVRISNADTAFSTKFDTDGSFSVIVSSDTKTLMADDIGFERKTLDLVSDCNKFEIILQSRSTYDFMSPARVDRRRKKQFNKLLALHQSAFRKGIFTAEKPCYIDKFIPDKKRKRSIKQGY